MAEVGHQHSFRRSTRMDACHYYRNTGICQCGAAAQLTTERDPVANPQRWRMWMDKDCDRCQEIKRGDHVTHHVLIYRGEEILREETWHYKQGDDEPLEPS